MSSRDKTRRMEIVTHYLEITDPGEFRPSHLVRKDFSAVLASDPSPELNRFLYTAVGGDHYWIQRLDWTYDRWMEYLERPELETWIAHVGGNPAGYFELEEQPQSSFEIVQFGLLPRYIGQGLGGLLLTCAIQRAWDRGASRVWLHTASHDHPNAVAHYQARGMRIYRTERFHREMPASPPGPWPGARNG